MRTCYIYLFLFMTLSASAQPTISSTWVPVAGLNNRIVNFKDSTLNKGSAGAGMTWDFSSIDTAGSSQNIYINPISSTYTSSFPGATDCAIPPDSGYYSYDKLNGNVYQLLGGYFPNSGRPQITVFTDPQDIFHFPITFGSTFTDSASWIQSYFYAGSMDTQLAHIKETVTADAYGTLTTRAGTFDNVIRVHTHHYQTDTDYALGNSPPIISDRYSWLSSSYPGIILAYISYDTGYHAFVSAYYSDTRTTGVNTLEHAGITSWTIAPQPANDISTLTVINNNQSKKITIRLYNQTGSLVKELVTSLSHGKNEIGLNISSLADGIYIVSILADDTTQSQKMVIKH